jgi:hypothetical protein
LCRLNKAPSPDGKLARYFLRRDALSTRNGCVQQRHSPSAFDAHVRATGRLVSKPPPSAAASSSGLSGPSHDPPATAILPQPARGRLLPAGLLDSPSVAVVTCPLLHSVRVACPFQVGANHFSRSNDEPSGASVRALTGRARLTVTGSSSLLRGRRHRHRRAAPPDEG